MVDIDDLKAEMETTAWTAAQRDFLTKVLTKLEEQEIHLGEIADKFNRHHHTERTPIEPITYELNKKASSSVE